MQLLGFSFIVVIDALSSPNWLAKLEELHCVIRSRRSSEKGFVWRGSDPKTYALFSNGTFQAFEGQ